MKCLLFFHRYWEKLKKVEKRLSPIQLRRLLPRIRYLNWLLYLNFIMVCHFWKGRTLILCSNTFYVYSEGLVHLEALEMLSQQCQSRITPQIRRLTSQRKIIIDEIDALCSRSDESDDHDSADSDILDLQTLEQNLSSSFDRVCLEVSLKKLMNVNWWVISLGLVSNINFCRRFEKEFLTMLKSTHR